MFSFQVCRKRRAVVLLACLVSAASCGTKGPTYDEALQTYESEQQTCDRLDKEVDDLVIQDTRNTMARTERDTADWRRIDPNQSESEYEKRLKEIESKSAKERTDELLMFKERLSKAKRSSWMPQRELWMS